VRRALLAGAVVAVAVVAFLVLRGGKEHLVVRADPVFNLLYDDDAVQRVATQGDEVLRLRAERAGLRMDVAIRPLALEPYDGDVSSGLLPIVADGLRGTLEESVPGFDLLEEGRARVNDAPGYELTYKGDEVFEGTDVLVVPGPQARAGYVLSFRVRGRPAVDRELYKAAKSAFRSFRFGTERA
jgi:hypothetical protein